MLLETKNIFLRLITEDDVDFLLSLRLNENLNKYLNQVSDEKQQQIDWIKEYKVREANGIDYYFVIVDKDLGDLGFVRVYDINYQDKTFTWGSWIIKEEHRPKYAAIESFVLSHEFAFNELTLKLSLFDARNSNSKAINFYNRFGAKLIRITSQDHFFELSKTKYLQLKYTQYYKFLLRD